MLIVTKLGRLGRDVIGDTQTVDVALLAHPPFTIAQIEYSKLAPAKTA